MSASCLLAIHHGDAPTADMLPQSEARTTGGADRTSVKSTYAWTYAVATIDVVFPSPRHPLCGDDTNTPSLAFL